MPKVRRLVVSKLRAFGPYEVREPGTIHEFERDGDDRWPPVAELDRQGSTTEAPSGARLGSKVDREVLIAAGGPDPELPEVRDQ